ncbi:MAG: hypothetical protein JNL83_31770 [Myxococcales bacterium]|nr:hypothetical protein [Myxococcales bacterium]
MRASLALVAAVLALGACDAYDHDIGSTPFLCGTFAEKRCPADYACIEDPNTGDEICVSSASITTAVDCADDSAIEPNNTLAEATPVANGAYTRLEVAICPPTDADTFALPLAAPATIELEIVLDRGATLRAAILNEGGVPIATGTLDEGSRTVRAVAAAERAGTYYARVSSPTGRANNYSITIRAR